MDYLRDLRDIVGHQPLLSAGASVVVIQDTKILLNLRTDTRTWGIPGGSMELGETLAEAAIRELWEETGLSVESLIFLHVFSGPQLYFEYPNGDQLHSVAALYRADRWRGVLQHDEESLELGFFSLDDLPEMEPRSRFMMQWLQENPMNWKE